MELWISIGIAILAYLIGAIPFGFIFVKIKTGEDIRGVQSGRTGGTNAMRAAGIWIGLFTAVVDGLKGACVVWLARALVPGNLWLEIICPIAAIFGHNNSIFLLRRNEEGKLRLGGGAGGAACVGGSVGLWGFSALSIIPLAGVIFYFIGYASVATMSVALLSTIIFGIRAYMGLSPWQYALYGLGAEILLVWALRPNIKRLVEGSERIHGFRARHKKDAEKTAAG